MTDKPAPAIATSLAASIPPLPLDHAQAYALLLAADPATQSDVDFDALVRGYRAKRLALAQAQAARANRPKRQPRTKAKTAAAAPSQGDGEAEPVMELPPNYD